MAHRVGEREGEKSGKIGKLEDWKIGERKSEIGSQQAKCGMQREGFLPQRGRTLVDIVKQKNTRAAKPQSGATLVDRIK
jgi:hypothetical protein